MIRTYEEAVKFVNDRIRTDPLKMFRGEFGLKGSARFLELLGNPQNRLKVIHVAGTSGKGSTCFFASQILGALGFSTSLTISPHLVDMRERCQINNELISKKEFVTILNSMIPAIEEMKKSEYEKPSYFMLLLGLSFLAAANHKVDYAVVETGFGGLYDGTNNVSREDKVCIINRIGLDHTEILGNTVEAIALQKAGIIGNGNMTFSPEQDAGAKKVIKKRTNEACARLEFITEPENIFDAGIINDRAVFSFRRDDLIIRDIVLATPAYYQIFNCSLAMAAVAYLGKRDGFAIDEVKIKKKLSAVAFGGRMQSVKKGSKRIILDGAHNPQKMENFIDSLKRTIKGKPCFLVSFKEGKDYKKMLDLVMPVAGEIIITDFDIGMDMAHKSQDPEDIGQYLKSTGFNQVKIVKGPLNAYKALLESDCVELVVTGSLYLLSFIYPLAAESK